MVVEISRPSAVGFSSASKAESGGISSGADERRRDGSGPPSSARRARRYFISSLSSGRRRNGTLARSASETGNVEAVAERLQRRVADLLGLMGDHLPLARRAHAVALDGLGEDDGRLALVVGRGLVGGVDLDRVVAAARQRPDLVVAPVGDHRRRLGIAAEEILADVGAVLGLEVLVFAVDAFFHQLAQLAGMVLPQAARPNRSPTGT